MQQIFRRIKRILEAEKNFSDDSNFPDSEEEELKRIIEDLNKKTGDSDKDNKRRSETQDSDWNKQTRTNSSNNVINDLKSAFLILEVPESASNEEIRDAYYKKIKEYHPDRVQNLGQEIRNLADKKTKEINQAYEFIKNYRNFK